MTAFAGFLVALNIICLSIIAFFAASCASGNDEDTRHYYYFLIKQIEKNEAERRKDLEWRLLENVKVAAIKRGLSGADAELLVDYARTAERNREWVRNKAKEVTK